MAFAKTQKRIRNGVLSVYFKIALKISSFTKQRISISAYHTVAHFCLSIELPGIEPWSTACLRTIFTSKPNTQVKECHLYMYMKPFRSAEW